MSETRETPDLKPPRSLWTITTYDAQGRPTTRPVCLAADLDDYIAAVERQHAEAMAEKDERIARWEGDGGLHVAIAELTGYGPDWPEHGNAPLAIAASYALLKSRAERAEVENTTLREQLAAAQRLPKLWIDEALNRRASGPTAFRWAADELDTALSSPSTPEPQATAYTDIKQVDALIAELENRADLPPLATAANIRALYKERSRLLCERIEQLEAVLAAIPNCATCEGEGWLMKAGGDICPDCDGAPHILGGTGKRMIRATPEPSPATVCEDLVLDEPPVIVTKAGVLKRRDTPEQRAYWDFIERTAAEVRANRPSWLSPEPSTPNEEK